MVLPVEDLTAAVAHDLAHLLWRQKIRLVWAEFLDRALQTGRNHPRPKRPVVAVVVRPAVPVVLQPAAVVLLRPAVAVLLPAAVEASERLSLV